MEGHLETRIGNLLARWVALCARNALTTLSVVAVLTGSAAALAWQFLSIDSDMSKLIRPAATLGWYADNEAFKTAFPEQQGTAVVVVSGRNVSAVDASARRIFDLLRDQPAFEFVYAPALDDFFRVQRLYYLDLGDLEDWLEGVRYDYGVMLRLAEGADLVNAAFTLADQVAATPGLPLQHPLASIARSFQSSPPVLEFEAYPHLDPVPEEGADYHLVIVLKGTQHLDRSQPDAQLIAQLRELLAREPAESGVQVRLTGEVVLADEEIGAALEGIGLAGTLSLFLLALILGVGVRSLRTILVIFLVLLVGVVLTLGFAVLAVGSFNTLALIFVVMFFGLGVDFAVHYALRCREFGHTPDAVETAARDISPALLLCALTTSVAFLSFVPTDYRGLGELGIISAGGMFIAFSLTLTLIPALYAVFGTPRTSGSSSGLPAPVLGARPGLILLITLCLSLVALWFARDLRFDYSVLAMRDASTEAMSTLLELQRDGVATDYSIMVMAPGAAAVGALKARLEQIPEVGTVQTPADLVPVQQAEKAERLAALAALLDTIEPVQAGDTSPDALAGLDEAVAYLSEVEDRVRPAELPNYRAFIAGLRALRGDLEAYRRLSEALGVQLASELKMLRRMACAPVFGLEDLPEDLLARLITPDGRHLLSVQPQLPLTSREQTTAFIEAVSAVAPNIAGRAVVEWGVGGVAVESFLEAVVLSVVLIFGLLVVYFRALWQPLLVFVPLGLAALFSFAIMQVTGLNLNMANILVVPLIFGLGVDAGIHVVHRYQVSGSIQALFESSTARAVLISALTTIGTFFSLSFSPHKGAASIGLLLFVAISLMLLATFVVLPALLKVIRLR